MGVYCDKLVGYSIDIKEDWELLTNEQKDFWLGEFNKAEREEYKKIEFVPYYNKTKSLKDKITIVYDGMNGEYCKLMFIVDFELSANEEDCDSIVNSINTLLAEAPVPFSIKQNMKEVYKNIFGKDLNVTSNIKPSYLVHWH